MFHFLKKKQKPSPVQPASEFPLMKDLDQLPVQTLMMLANKALEYQDRCFETVQAKGYWMTKDLQLIPFSQLEPSHTWNILNMLKRKYTAKSIEASGSNQYWLSMLMHYPPFGMVLKRAQELNLPITDFLPKIQDYGPIDNYDYDRNTPLDDNLGD